MANTDRRIINNEGKQFIPMNIDGGEYDKSILSGKKIIVLILITLVTANVYNLSLKIDVASAVFMWLVYGLILQKVLRKFILEEAYLYKSYKKIKQIQNTTPNLLWNISNIKESDEGSILTYSDAKIAVIVRLERDTIVGKGDNYRENHFDALSDFYRELALKDLRFVQFNIMEQAGKDKRLPGIDKIASKSDNKNIVRLMEQQSGYIREITRTTLFETEYFILYYNEISKVDYIIDDATDCLNKLLDGSYNGYTVLNSREIVDVVKELYGVSYFNYNDAMLNIYKNSGMQLKNVFNIEGIQFIDGEYINIGKREINLLLNLTSGIDEDSSTIKSSTIKQSLIGKNNKELNTADGINKEKPNIELKEFGSFEDTYTSDEEEIEGL